MQSMDFLMHKKDELIGNMNSPENLPISTVYRINKIHSIRRDDRRLSFFNYNHIGGIYNE